ncbi:TMV resistance protein N-like [Quercus robur]|uniref:TMV resistance protein N-like n=1 Tax=Quercus robur TaxID=38942 RepID=UPI0021636E58|nr:TMV resistance protein N-like [Quercus robur]
MEFYLCKDDPVIQSCQSNRLGDPLPAGTFTFRDNERLERGKSISPELLKAIEESRFAIVILSKTYASSTWSLDELTKIIQCMKEKEMTVLPIFYEVDPSNVRKHMGTFAQAFAKHKEHLKENTEKVQTWRATLSEVPISPGGIGIHKIGNVT